MKLAIKGHPTRGGEVIQLLEMLGGVNFLNLKGGEIDSFYYIYKDNDIYLCSSTNTGNFIVFTLEEFLEKFPYKVGDKASSKYLENYIIEKAEWESCGNRVIYKLQGQGWYRKEELQPYEEETNMKTDCKKCGLHYGSARCFDMDYCPNHNPKSYAVGLKDGEVIECGVNMKDNKTTGSRIDFSLTERIELDLGDTHEVVVENGKTYVVKKKPTYPKYYTECEASELSLNPVDVALAQGVCMGAFAKLIVIRNAYWEIAGKQLGLDKPWKPDWESETEQKYTIVTDANEICSGLTIQCNAILAFPTEEMRDAFYENFKEEIEMCKELL